MEILSSNYNCKNRFVAGFVPFLEKKDGEDQVDHPIKINFESKQTKKANKPNKSKNRNFCFHITTTNTQTACNLTTSFTKFSIKNQLPTTIYQIDISKICTNTPMIYSPRSSNQQQQKTNGNEKKSKKALRNKKQKEAKRRRRKERHVHFPEQDDLIAIVIVIENDEFIKEYRNKYWENFAIDRNRFQHRVKKVADKIEQILLPEHRDKIFKDRFSCDESEEENNNRIDSGCDSHSNNDEDSDQSSNEMIKDEIDCNVKILKRKKTKKVIYESNRESGFEQTEDSQSDVDQKEDEDENDEFSLSIIDISQTTLHYINLD